MSLARAAVKNPVAANLVMWFVVVVGLYFAFTLVREMFPNAQSEQITITVPYPGAVPDQVEKSITRRVEREIEDVDDLEKIESTILEGVSITIATLEEGADRQGVLNEIRAEMDKVLPDLPDGAEEPQITLVRPYFPVIAVVIHGDVSEDKLHDATTRIRDDLLDMTEISQVVVSGMRDREIWVEIQPEKLEEHKLTFEQVGNAIAASNRDIPGGQIKGLSGNVNVRTLGEKSRAIELEALVVRSNPDGMVVRLRDLGGVRGSFEDRVERGRFEGHPAATVTVFKTPEEDALKIAARVKAYCAQRKGTLPGGIQIDTITDLSRFIAQRIELMVRNAKVGLILVVLALVAFLNLRVAFWVAIGLPISFLGTFALMYYMGATINLISLFGLIIVLGLIVDDAIIIGESIFTRLRSGMSPEKAAIEGANEVMIPVVAAVSTTIIAFLPLAYIEGHVGTFLGVLPLVVIAALLVSVLESFYILPAHLAHPGKWRKGARWLAEAFPERFRTRVRALIAWLSWFKYSLTEQWIQNALERVLRFAIQWRYATVASAVSLTICAAGLVIGGIVPFVLLSDNEAETVVLNLEMASGTPESRTVAVIDQLERIVKERSEVKTVFSVVGKSFSDEGQIVPAADPATVGQINVELITAEERQNRGLATSRDFVSDLRARVSGIPGVSKLSVEARAGGPGGPDLEVRVRCDDVHTLAQAVDLVREEMGRFQGVEQIEDDLTIGKLEARLRIKDSAESLGLKTSSLALQMRHALYGFEAQDLQEEDEEVTVRVLLPESARKSLKSLRRLRVATPQGYRVPLDEVASVTTTRGYASLSRVSGKRAATIRASVDSQVGNVADVTAALEERVADIGERFPGTSVSFEGRKKETTESLGSLKLGFPIALFCMYAIVAILFRSYFQPMLVMLAIPFAFVGAIIGHWIMGSEFTVLSMIGMVALAGIVVNDSLILVNRVNRHRINGMELQAAVIRGARDRIRAILLTSVTTICGLGPLMLETSFQAQFLIPMAISLVFGLAMSTVVTPILLPCFYMIYEDCLGAIRWIYTGHTSPDAPTAG